MASPATSTFLGRWRRTQDVERRALVKIELTDPTAQTLYLSHETLTTPDGQRWDGALTDLQAVEAPGDFLDDQFPATSCSFTLSAQQLPWQTSSPSLGIFKDWLWIGAKVTLWL